jgi:hypothetical protein
MRASAIRVDGLPTWRIENVLAAVPTAVSQVFLDGADRCGERPDGARAVVSVEEVDVEVDLVAADLEVVDAREPTGA